MKTIGNTELIVLREEIKQGAQPSRERVVELLDYIRTLRCIIEVQEVTRKCWEVSVDKVPALIRGQNDCGREAYEFFEEGDDAERGPKVVDPEDDSGRQ